MVPVQPLHGVSPRASDWSILWILPSHWPDYSSQKAPETLWIIANWQNWQFLDLTVIILLAKTKKLMIGQYSEYCPLIGQDQEAHYPGLGGVGNIQSTHRQEGKIHFKSEAHFSWLQNYSGRFLNLYRIRKIHYTNEEMTVMKFNTITLIFQNKKCPFLVSPKNPILVKIF